MAFDLGGDPAAGERLTQFNKGWHVTVQVAPSNRSSLRSIRAGSPLQPCCARLLFGCATLQTASGRRRDAHDLLPSHPHQGKPHDHLQGERPLRRGGPQEDQPLPARLARERADQDGSRVDRSCCGRCIARPARASRSGWSAAIARPKTNIMLRKPFERRRQAQPAHARQGRSTSSFRAFRSTNCAPPACARSAAASATTRLVELRALDTGSVRHWPRMPDAQLAKVLAKGQLASHNASDDRSARRVNVAEATSPAAARRVDAVVPEQAVRRRRRSRERCRGGRDRHRSAPHRPRPPRRRSPAPRWLHARPTSRPSWPLRPSRAARRSAPSRCRRRSPCKAETYQVASAGSVPVKPAGFEIASAASTPVALDNVQVAQAGSALPVRAEVSGRRHRRAAPVRPAQAASLVAPIGPVGERRHQRSRLLAGTAERRGGRCRANHRRPLDAGLAPRRRQGRDRERRAMADRRPRQRSHADRRCAVVCGAAGSAASRATALAAGDSRRRRPQHRHGRGQAVDDDARRAATAAQGTGCRAGRRPFQRSLGARDDGQPERATLPADDALRLAGLPQSRTDARQACVGRDR